MIEDLDPVIHAPKRLAAMALLSSASNASFTFLRDHLGLSDSDLSKQMATLEKAGYVTITKSGRGRGATTTFRTTRTGQAAYRRHRKALRALLESSETEDA
jgi:DNA-binding MarR family transcriptional regulator